VSKLEPITKPGPAGRDPRPRWWMGGGWSVERGERRKTFFCLHPPRSTLHASPHLGKRMLARPMAYGGSRTSQHRVHW